MDQLAARVGGSGERAPLEASPSHRECAGNAGRSRASRTSWLWDPPIGDPGRSPIRAHEGSVAALAFSPDGKTLATVAGGETDPTIRLWDPGTREPIAEPIRHPGGAFSVAFSPRAQLLATGGDGGTVRFWDPDPGTPVRPPVNHPGGVMSMAFSPDGRILASAGFEGSGVWRADRIADAAPRRCVSGGVQP